VKIVRRAPGWELAGIDIPIRYRTWAEAYAAYLLILELLG